MIRNKCICFTFHKQRKREKNVKKYTILKAKVCVKVVGLFFCYMTGEKKLKENLNLNMPLVLVLLIYRMCIYGKYPSQGA